MSSYTCQNPQKAQHHEAINLWALGDNDVSVHRSLTVTRSALWDYPVGEAEHVLEQGLMGTLCTFHSILLLI